MPIPALEVTRFLVEVADASLAIDKTRLEWLVAKGRRLLQKVPAGDYDQAAQVWSLIGLAQARLGQHEEALECHLKALRLRPGVDAHANNAGAALLELGRPAEALDMLVEAYERGARESVATLTNLAEAFNCLGQRDDALELFREALTAADHSDAADLYGLAQGAGAIGLEAESIELYARSMSLRLKRPIGTMPALDFVAGLPQEHLRELEHMPGGLNVLGALERARSFAPVRAMVEEVRADRGTASDAADRDSAEMLASTRPWRAGANAAVLGRTSACGT